MESISSHIDSLKIEVIKLFIIVNAYAQATMTDEQKKEYKKLIEQSGVFQLNDNNIPLT
jgi:hypothetical protein